MLEQKGLIRVIAPAQAAAEATVLMEVMAVVIGVVHIYVVLAAAEAAMAEMVVMHIELLPLQP